MATELNRMHSDLTSKLENLAEGVRKHSAEPDFPSSVKEEDIRAMRAELEALRTSYKETRTLVRIKHDEYKTRFEVSDKEHAKLASLLYASFGKKNQVLADFGLTPHKERTSSKVQSDASSKPA